MVVSNPGSIPGGLSGTEANYGNGWSCVDVCAEIIKAIQKKYDESDDRLRDMVQQNLRVCFLRKIHGAAYADGGTIGMHAKHFWTTKSVMWGRKTFTCAIWPNGVSLLMTRRL